MRTHVTTAAAVLMLCTHGITAAQTPARTTPSAALTDTGRSAAAATFSPRLAGTWRSAPDELKLTSEFDRSVWGPDATSVRTVDLTIQPSGEGTLTVTRKVLDARGRTVAASTSIEEAQIAIGGSEQGTAGRIEHSVKVVKAERRYPDDPDYHWPLDGLGVQVVTFADGDGNTIEVRFDTPEGRGSFWETLTRGKAARRPS
jgi:hypothetical protein